VLLPHARVHDPELLELGAAFGTEIIMKTTLPAGYHGILSIEARRRYRRPFFHVEVGGGTVLWEHLIEKGLTGLRNLLVFKGMLPGKLVLPRHQFFLPGRDNLAMPAPIEGLVIQHVALGQAVVKGQPLATIENPLNEEHAVIRARTNGIVHDLNVRAKVNTGEDVVGVIGFGPFNQPKTKPWRNSVERRTNRPGETVSIRDAQIFSADGLCWICHRPQSVLSPQPAKRGVPRSDRKGLRRTVVRS
jgi:predicted deacylase